METQPFEKGLGMRKRELNGFAKIKNDMIGLQDLAAERMKDRGRTPGLASKDNER